MIEEYNVDLYENYTNVDLKRYNFVVGLLNEEQAIKLKQYLINEGAIEEEDTTNYDCDYCTWYWEDTDKIRLKTPCEDHWIEEE